MLTLHDFHARLGGRFSTVNGAEVIEDYGDATAEYRAVRETAGIFDLSFRSRICLLGGDRQKFLNGQVTNNIKDLKQGEGCYAAVINAKGKMQSDVRVFCLAEEILLDFEPGLTQLVTGRLEKYVIADDVQIIDVAAHYGLLSVQGPQAAGLMAALNLGITTPATPFAYTKICNTTLGEIYIANVPRLGIAGFDLYVPGPGMESALELLIKNAPTVGGRLCGWNAFEMLRIEQGIPRFGADMDDTNLPPEVGLDRTAVSYTKGCYIGQEVIARIRTYGQVAKKLCKLQILNADPLPAKGAKLFFNDREAGYMTSATRLPSLIVSGLGYVRREANQVGTELSIGTPEAREKAITLAVV